MQQARRSRPPVQQQTAPQRDNLSSDQIRKLVDSQRDPRSYTQEEIDAIDRWVQLRRQSSAVTDLSDVATSDLDSVAENYDPELVARKNAQILQLLNEDPDYRREYEEFKRGLQLSHEDRTPQGSPYLPAPPLSSPRGQMPISFDFTTPTEQSPHYDPQPAQQRLRVPLQQARPPMQQNPQNPVETELPDRSHPVAEHQDLTDVIGRRRNQLNHALEQSQYHAMQLLSWQAEAFRLQAEMNADAANAVKARERQGN
ncbi:hypothetical protein G7046_g833 [Stylonectria norvegica]|nr:hypothetical protein G7046_g833 [Stylonectria norvegica]